MNTVLVSYICRHVVLRWCDKKITHKRVNYRKVSEVGENKNVVKIQRKGFDWSPSDMRNRKAIGVFTII